MNSDKRIFFLLLLLLLTCSLVAIAQEQITLTTYYPAPFGEYQNVRFVPTTSPGICDATRSGLTYYDSGTNQLLLCNGATFTWDIVGGAAGGSNHWTLSAPNLYPNDATWNVGIGTPSPGAKLDILGSSDLLRLQGSTGGTRAYKFYTTDGPIIGNTLRLSRVDDQGFFSIGMSAVGADDFVVNNTGNVGVGTANPTAKFHVMASNGAAPTMYMTNGNPAPGVNWMGFVSGLTANLQWNQITQAGDMGIIYSNQTDGNSNTSNFVIAPWINSVPAGGIRMDGFGNVGIPRLNSTISGMGVPITHNVICTGYQPHDFCALSYCRMYHIDNDSGYCWVEQTVISNVRNWRVCARADNDADALAEAAAVCLDF
ncbi:MAG: hypothetical protein HY590_00620 [Candidatus Omnitrophica bacterium]|nr:hypothetical protein [Candidatus Omnitrophota bacterium]